MKAILLDAAGTLFDLAEPVGETYTRFARTAGFELDPATVEDNFRTAFQELAPPDYSTSLDGDELERNWWKTMVQRATQINEGEKFDSLYEKLFLHYEKPSAWQLYPDTLPFLQAAQKNYRLGVVSNFDQRLLTILAGLKLSPFFEIIISSSTARSQKPEALIFRIALEKLALTPHEVIHIGDSRRADFEGARASGLHAIHLDRKNGDTLSLEKIRKL